MYCRVINRVAMSVQQRIVHYKNTAIPNITIVDRERCQYVEMTRNFNILMIFRQRNTTIFSIRSDEFVTCGLQPRALQGNHPTSVWQLTISRYHFFGVRSGFGDKRHTEFITANLLVYVWKCDVGRVPEL